MEPSDDIQVVLSKLPDRYWTGPKLVVRGLYRYEHAGFGGAFSPGEYVTLEREPGNAYDKNAVKVILADGKMLGYIAKEMAIALSRELDGGMKFLVQISQAPFSEEKWGQCTLDVTFKIWEKDFEILEGISHFERPSNRRYKLRSNVAYVGWNWTPLIEAVSLNDVKKARDLIRRYGFDPFTTGLFCEAGHDFTFLSGPLLMMARSVEMYKLLVDSGAELYPRSELLFMGGVIFGKEHNLLDELWRGPTMDVATQELADYLVFTEYDMSLRGNIEDIRKSCERTDGACPYENNKQYVLEWCDMEERAIAAAIEIMKREEQGPYSLGHDLMHFISDWMTHGYDKAVVLCKGDLLSEDEIPPRYVYPERILKRGFQYADSGANPVEVK